MAGSATKCARRVSIMLHRGAEITGDHPREEGDGKLVRTMRFAGVEAVIRAWRDWKAAP